MSHAFRKRNAQALYDLHYGPNMTPMVDVVMVILIFFMASAAMLGPEWFLKSALPVQAPGATSDAPPARVRVILTAMGASVAIDAAEPTPTDFTGIEKTLREQAAAHGANLIVLVEPAADAPYDAVVRVHEWCARLGITKVGLPGKL